MIFQIPKQDFYIQNQFIITNNILNKNKKQKNIKIIYEFFNMRIINLQKHKFI